MEIAARVHDLGLDVAVVVAYGHLLPPSLLVATRRGFVNVHFSLLPRWRGAAPVQRAILAGDAATGVSLMALEEGLDTGPVFASEATAIGPAERAGALAARLAASGGRLLVDHLAGYVAGDLPAEPQDDAAATAAAKVKPGEARLTAGLTALDVDRRVRAFHPRPGAWAEVDGGRLGILEAAAAPGDTPAPGRIEVHSGAVLLGCSDGPIELLRVRPAGKAPMTAAAWMNGRRGEPARLG
jgi:methionyl-tRNA formyltransferase